MRTALDVHRALLTRDVPHEIVRLQRRIAGADELPSALGLRDGCIAVRLYAVRPRRGPERLVAVLVPAGAVPEHGALLSALSATADGSEVELAPDALVSAVTRFAPGLVSPVPLPPDVEVLADAAVGATEVVYAPAGEGGVALGVRTRDLLVAVGARAAALTSARVPAPASQYADILDLDLDRDIHLDRQPDRGLDRHGDQERGNGALVRRRPD